MESPKLEGAEIDVPEAVIDFFQTDILPGADDGDVDRICRTAGYVICTSGGVGGEGPRVVGKVSGTFKHSNSSPKSACPPGIKSRAGETPRLVRISLPTVHQRKQLRRQQPHQRDRRQLRQGRPLNPRRNPPVMPISKIRPWVLTSVGRQDGRIALPPHHP